MGKKAKVTRRSASAETVAVNKSTEESRVALRKVHSHLFEFGKSNGNASSSPGDSNKIPNDPFQALAEKGVVIEPPFDPLSLAMLRENSSELGQCIDAMAVNIDATGFRFISRVKEKDADESTKKKIFEEKILLENFFNYCCEESFASFRWKLRSDMESTGNCYFEVVRDGSGAISGFYHIPSYQMRLTKREDVSQLVMEHRLIRQKDGSFEVQNVPVYKKFRRYVQARSLYVRSFSEVQEGKKVWFKEFGDTRKMDKTNGRYEGEGGKGVSPKKLATEIVHFCIYSPRSAYGMPRFIGNLLSILGDRGAEEINFVTFQNNNIPSMAFLVSNGALTQGTLDRIGEFVQSQIKNSGNRSKFLILEAEPFIGEDGEDGGQPKIDIKELNASQIGDALFQNYSENNQSKIRRAFRLPSLLLGKGEDMTRAVADTARKLADEQIFAPARDEFDTYFNRKILPEMGIRFHRFQSNTPNTTDNAQLIKMLNGAEKTGGMTPMIARQALETILGMDLPEFPDEFPKDLPFSLTMAEAVKNQADPAEPGQQATAIKTLKALGMLGDDGSLADIEFDQDEELEVVTKKLFALNNAAESIWRSQARA